MKSFSSGSGQPGVVGCSAKVEQGWKEYLLGFDGGTKSDRRGRG
jgi:hypothetical protein